MVLKSLYYNFFPRFIIKKCFNTHIDYFGFLIHLGEIKDLKDKYLLIKFVPDFILSFFIRFFPPIIISKIEGRDVLRNKFIGFIILCPITANQMLKNRDIAIKKIEKAITFSEKLGLKIIGLGAYTSSITNGGQDLLGKFNIAITNGNANTASVAVKDINRIINYFLKDSYGNLIIAIVGATGSIGSAVSKLISQNNPKKLILIGRNTNNLKNLESEIQILNKNSNLFLSTEIQNTKLADIIIVATSASGAIIKSNYLKRNAIIYDITQPRNVNKQLINERSDIVIIDGGLVETKNVFYTFNFGLPKDIIFACLAETIILTIKKLFFNFSIGKVSLDKVKVIESFSKEVDFDSSPFYSFGKLLEKK